MTLDDFLDRVASDAPTPGGGSVSALASSLGCALSEMVSRISLKKAENAEELNAILQRSGELRSRLLQLVEEDARSYQAVVEAFSLPKGTEEEKKSRKRAVQEALVGATKPPGEVMDLSLEVLGLAGRLAEVGSASACSDAGVAALMAYAGLHGGHLNVRINLSSVKDEELRSRMESETSRKLEEGKKTLESVLTAVESRL
jgi:formiminotetrahydrofolate cyclodeaminase